MNGLFEDLEKNLTALGFTAVETNVYLALLKEEQLKVSELSAAAKISRTQLYPLLNRMVKKNYIELIASKPVSYNAIPPQDLVRVLEEERKEQFSLLLDLRSRLDELRPIQTIAASQYEIKIIKGEKNILSKIAKLTNAAEKEIINTAVFERSLAGRSKELRDLTKRKASEGVKTIVYPSISLKNIGNINKLKGRYNGATFGALIKEEPYSTYIFDRYKVLLAFYNAQKEQYDTGLLIENSYLAESFAAKNIAPIESYPLAGELFISMLSPKKQRAFLLPQNCLNGLSKKQLFDLGYSIGYSTAMKDIKEKGNRKMGPKYVLGALSIQLSVSGWAKLSLGNNSDKLRLVVENPTVGCKLIEGTISGFLSVVGKYSVQETKCIEKGAEFCEFAVDTKEKK